MTGLAFRTREREETDGRRHEAMERLARPFSIEVAPRELARVGSLGSFLDPGTPVYITAIPGADLEEIIAAASRVAEDGMRAVPHVAARGFATLDDVDRFLGRLVQSADVKEVLVLAGSGDLTGAVESSLDVLRAGLLEAHGIQRAGVAGHPEGNPVISAEALRSAIAEKNRIAAESGLDLYLVTQFCFAPEPYVRWEQEIRAAGNRLPVHAGIPGVTSTRKLLAYGLACGVGPSLRILRRKTRGIARLLGGGSFHPGRIVDGIVEAVAADPASLLRRLHFYPFGGLVETAQWIRQVRDGTAELGRR